MRELDDVDEFKSTTPCDTCQYRRTNPNPNHGCDPCHTCKNYDNPDHQPCTQCTCVKDGINRWEPYDD